MQILQKGFIVFFHRVTSLADKLKLEFAILYRSLILSKDDEETGDLLLLGNVTNRNVFLLDGTIDGPTAFQNAARTLKENGALNIYLIATHGIFSENALEEIENCSDIYQVIVTNTIPVYSGIYEKLKIIDISKVFAEAIRCIHNGESINLA